MEWAVTKTSKVFTPLHSYGESMSQRSHPLHVTGMAARCATQNAEGDARADIFTP
jgi:hypothetical protein